jgi:hypothetical protein
MSSWGDTYLSPGTLPYLAYTVLPGKLGEVLLNFMNIQSYGVVVIFNDAASRKICTVASTDFLLATACFLWLCIIIIIIIIIITTTTTTTTTTII